jgi:hypothetical protein
MSPGDKGEPQILSGVFDVSAPYHSTLNVVLRRLDYGKSDFEKNRYRVTKYESLCHLKFFSEGKIPDAFSASGARFQHL